ncbi:MAG TPA: HAD family hydrolase [Candidatus Limnocylindria bacterium]|jgi:phosphoglycolate phosphatase-like HAD superfamily hydrolase|nr:HAD family hydrolase [Candidatus Limnocylindria bacterium]
MELRPGFRPHPRLAHVVFDWDGTLSLIRAGWGEVMLAQWLALIPPLPGESVEQLRHLAHDDIWRLNGKPSIHQAAQLAQRIGERGGRPLSAVEHENDYQRRLGEVVGERLNAVRSGTATADAWLVTDARRAIETLAGRGLMLHVVSGTQRRFVAEEADALGVAQHFGGRIHGPTSEQDTAYSKRGVLDAILRDYGIAGGQLLAFGDGHVEIEQTKMVGGLAVAVATDEREFHSGRIDAAKRDRLMGVGADVCIADFRELDALLPVLFP